MNVIILHNSEDKASRDFVASIPKDDGNTYCIIDWYKQPDEIKSRTCPCHFGQPYQGPDPSAFPELIYEELTPPDIKVRDKQDIEISVKQPASWSRIRKAESVAELRDPKKVNSRKPVAEAPEIKIKAEEKP